MKNPRVSSRTASKRLIVLAFGLVVAWGIFSGVREVSKLDDFIAVDFGGTHHMRQDFSISEFFLNGTNGFNVGREGGGGSSVCCVLLPKAWRPDLSVDVRWAINDWSQEIPSEITVGNYSSVRSGGVYRAKVPVEKYDMPGKIEIHFFTGGKVRAVVGWPVPEELNEGILPTSSHAAEFATAGQPTDESFTKKEYGEMERREESRKNKNEGGWK